MENTQVNADGSHHAPIALSSAPSPPRLRPKGRPTNPGLLQLIRSKRECQWKPTIQELKLGFRGWHQRGYLPHFDAPFVTQMVTFTLIDAIPEGRRAEWESILNDANDSCHRRLLEQWLDRSHGRCWLRRPAIANAVEEILLRENGDDYRMQAWAVMPNHVHLVVDVWQVPLSRLLQRWKGRSAREANRLLARRGSFWSEDYYDTVIRDEEHLRKAIRYVDQNAPKAFLVPSAAEWPWSSARHRDDYGRLPERFLPDDSL